MNKSELSRLNDPIEKQLYNDFLKQEKIFKKINFNEKISILIITDRNFGWSKGLQELFLKSSPNLNVGLIFDYQDDYIPAADVLIISGYLKNKDNYKILDRMKSKNKNVIAIMYANLDELIVDICTEYDIQHMYERQENSAYDFLCYINGLVA